MKVFKFDSKEYGVTFLKDGAVEIFEIGKESKTGFVFSTVKAATFFINKFTDIVEDKLKEGEK